MGITLLSMDFLLTALKILNIFCSEDFSKWTIFITNDNCPDYTWGLTEEQTRQSFAEIVRAHLDEMKRTDKEKIENQDRYNMAVTQEAFCFVDFYPERKNELIQRIKEGRIYVSPYFCNSLLAFQSVECAIRTFYPARRLEKEWGIKFDVAEHIEEPSLPWGAASILAGCGIKWLSKPFLKYDSTFSSLENPPIFDFEGPDGSKVRIIMDPWICNRYAYMQGAKLLSDPDKIFDELIQHYSQLGEIYPLNFILASGTHGDISPESGNQAMKFADTIIAYNKRASEDRKMFNAILPQFCSLVDKVQSEKPFIKTLKGCFGHSWDLWPISIAKYVADMREGERKFISAETLVSIASLFKADLKELTYPDRKRAEWLLVMLSDHAWNGTDDENRIHNAELRRKWSEELNKITNNLIKEAWNSLALDESAHEIIIFNSLSIPRSELIKIELPYTMTPIYDHIALDSQIIEEDGKRFLYFVSPEIPGFGLRHLILSQQSNISSNNFGLIVKPLELESPYYKLKISPETGGISSLIHKVTGRELVCNYSLCQTTYFDGKEHEISSFSSEITAIGPVLARIKISYVIGGINVTNFITVYNYLDRVDFDLRINKPYSNKEERLCHLFPLLKGDAIIRIETTGAVIKPKPQPEGDLLPGADTRRFAVQGFIDISLPEGPGVTIAPLDAYALRLDLGQIAFEALGNDQNFREVIKDQNKVANFQFRYSLRAHTESYNNAEAFEWSRSVANPLLVYKGFIPSERIESHEITIDSSRVIATCFKPAEEDGYILRLWEIGCKSGDVSIYTKGYKQAFQTDLLERNIQELKLINNRISTNLKANGFACIRLLR